MVSKTIWIEYTGQDSDLCVECANCTTLVDGVSSTPHTFCDVQYQDNEDDKCLKFKDIGGL